MPTYASNLKRRIGWDYRITQAGTSKWVWETITQTYKFVGYNTSYTHEHPLLKLRGNFVASTATWAPQAYNQSTNFDSLWGNYAFFDGFYLLGYTEDYTLNSSDDFVFDFVANINPPSSGIGSGTGTQDNSILKLYKADVNGYPSWLEFGVTSTVFFSQGSNRIRYKWYVKEKTVTNFELDYYATDNHRYSISQTTLAEDSSFVGNGVFPPALGFYQFQHRMKVVRNGNKIEFWRNGQKEFDITKTADTYYNYSFDPTTLDQGANSSGSFTTNNINGSHLYLDEIQLRVNNLTTSDLTSTVSPIKDNWFGTLIESSVGTLTCQAGFLYDESFNLNTPTTISADGDNDIQMGVELLQNEYNTVTTATNFVRFPEEGVPGIYIEDDYVATGDDYIVVDYVAQDYFATGAEYFATGPAFNVSGLMTQSFAGEFTMPPTLLGQLISIGSSLVSDTEVYADPLLGRPASAFISGSSNTDFSAGRIRPGNSTFAMDSDLLMSSGRLQQIASDLVAQTQMAPTHPFLLQGGEGIVAGASQVTTEGGYLQTLGSLNFSGASAIVTGSQATANLGIILKGFEVDALATSSVTSLGGLALPGISNLLSEFATEIVPGYLWSGQGLFTSTSAITSITSLLFNTPQSFMTMESTIEQPFLAGFRLLGQADLLSNGGTLAAGKLWIIDDYRRLTVQQQTRAFAIVAELRKINTVQETRLNTVEQELSLAKVKQETRQYKLPIAPIVFVSPTRTERI